MWPAAFRSSGTWCGQGRVWRRGARDLRDHIRAKPHLYAACRAFVMTRPAVFVIAIAAVATIGLTATPGFVLSRDPVANLPARFDAGWYGGITLDGYNWDHTFQRQRNIAFFPAMPLLMRPLGAVFGMYDDTASRERRMLRGLWAGTVVSLIAFFWALVLRLAARRGSHRRRTRTGRDASSRGLSLCHLFQRAIHGIALSSCGRWRVISFSAR